MLTCRICLQDFTSLKYRTPHIAICVGCVNTLNGSPEPAQTAEERMAAKLARGMRRNAERDLQSAEEWKRRKAQQKLNDIDAAVAAALHDWITSLLSKPENSSRDFQMLRAERRGLLRMEGFASYPSGWTQVAQRVRLRDKGCAICRKSVGLDVHHIVYLSKHGTNQQSNLVGLCRSCHEEEHDREFDWPEARDPEPISPIQPPPGLRPPTAAIAFPAPPPPPPPPPPPAPAPAPRMQSPLPLPTGTRAGIPQRVAAGSSSAPGPQQPKAPQQPAKPTPPSPVRPPARSLKKEPSELLIVVSICIAVGLILFALLI